MQVEHIRDRFLGTLLGVVVGDVLGSQFEGRSATEIQMTMGEQSTKMVGGGRLKLAPGEWTDDAAQAIAIATSFQKCHEFDETDVVLSMVDLFTAKTKGIGPHTQEVLSKLARDPEQGTTVARTLWYRSCGVVAGNGALARSIVAGMFYWNDVEKMVETTIRLCQLTHYDPRCVDAALVLNFLLIQCLHRRFSADLAQQAISFLEMTRKGPVYKKYALDLVADTLHEYSNFSPYAPWDQDKDAVPDALLKLPKLKVTELQTTGYVVHTMQLAVWMLINCNSFGEGVHRAVRIGGDADTQGAVTGALLGAKYGFSQIPNYWIAPLKDRARITSLGELLLNRSIEHEEKEFESGKRNPLRQPPRVL